MKVQSIKKLPSERALAAAVRMGSKRQVSIPLGIAAVNHAELAAQDQPPHSHLSSANDSRYGGSGPPPINMEMIRYQSWLRANSVVPDGMACWITDPKPHPKYGARWTNWSGARVEYLRRSRNSERQKKHLKPDDSVYARTLVRTDAEVYTYEFLARLHAWRMRNLYVKDVYLPSPAATKAKRLDTASLEPEVYVTHAVAVNDVPSARDRVHKSELEAVQVQWHRYQHHLERMGKSSNKGEINAPYVFGLMQLHPLGEGEEYHSHRRIDIKIKEDHLERYRELYQKLCNLEARKQLQLDKEERDSQLSAQSTVVAPEPASQEKGDSWWAQHMPAMGYLHETPAKADNDSVSEQVAAKETEMSPAEEQPVQREGAEQFCIHSESNYVAYREAVDEGRITPKMHNIWLCMAHKLRLGGHRAYLRGRTELTSLYVNTLSSASTLTVPDAGLKVGTMADDVKDDIQNPSKLLGKYTPSVSEALVYAGTIDRNLRKKQQEIDEYLRYVGGLDSFVKGAGGILVPQKIDVDEDVPWD